MRCTRFCAKHRQQPQALQARRVLSRSQPRSARAVRPSAASARSHHLERKKVRSACPAVSRYQSKHKASSRLHCVGRKGLAYSRGTNLQVQFRRRSCSFRIQRWYASPSKCKARLRLTERGLTLPSSGRAFGTPLKSNVSALSRMCRSVQVQEGRAMVVSAQGQSNASSLSAFVPGRPHFDAKKLKIELQVTRSAGRPFRFAGGRRTVTGRSASPSSHAAGA